MSDWCSRFDAWRTCRALSHALRVLGLASPCATLIFERVTLYRLTVAVDSRLLRGARASGPARTEDDSGR